MGKVNLSKIEPETNYFCVDVGLWISYHDIQVLRSPGFLAWQPHADFLYAFLAMPFCTLLDLTVISVSIIFPFVSGHALITALCVRTWISF